MSGATRTVRPSGSVTGTTSPPVPGFQVPSHGSQRRTIGHSRYAGTRSVIGKSDAFRYAVKAGGSAEPGGRKIAALNSSAPSRSYAPKTSGTPARATKPAMSRSKAAPASLFGEPNVVG